jgi:hypothetical protein
MIKYAMDSKQIRNALLDIVETTNPKSISTKVKNNREIYQVIEKQFGNSISEKIYNFLNPNQHICKNNNNKKFLSINIGYGFCGTANKCQCAKQSVSEKVSNYQANLSTTKKQEIQQKREQTNLTIYGTSNTGQIQQAKLKHREFYLSPGKTVIL